MRKFVMHFVTAVAVLGSTAAQAADLDYGVLRGPDEDVYIPPVDWSGVYIGGHGGYSSADMRVANNLPAYSVTALAALQYVSVTPGFAPSSRSIHETTYGGFAGYNLQLDDVVVGVEVDYTRGALRGRAEDIATVVSRADGSNGTLSRQGTTSLTDYGTVRARAGYVIGSFLPFATAGLAVARLEETSAFARITTGGGISFLPPPGRTSERYTFGFTVGAGLDFALTDNIVLRGEFQHVQFDHYSTNVQTTNSAGQAVSTKVANTIAVNTFRGGVAVKF